jgi:hypothetical protein
MIYSTFTEKQTPSNLTIEHLKEAYSKCEKLKNVYYQLSPYVLPNPNVFYMCKPPKPFLSTWLSLSSQLPEVFFIMHPDNETMFVEAIKNSILPLLFYLSEFSIFYFLPINV